MSDKYDRRQILKWLGTGLASVVLVPFGLTGCGGGGEEAPVETTTSDKEDEADEPKEEKESSEESGPTHEVPHPGNDEVPEAEATAAALGGSQRAKGGKSPKDGPSVQYQHKPNGSQNCGSCSLYVPDKDGDGFGACTMVEGKIHPCDFCILFSKHSGDNTVPCGA